MSIYEQCPILENDDFILRLFDFEDLYDLLKVYSDKHALPFLTVTIAMATIFIIQLKIACNKL